MKYRGRGDLSTFIQAAAITQVLCADQPADHGDERRARAAGRGRRGRAAHAAGQPAVRRLRHIRYLVSTH